MVEADRKRLVNLVGRLLPTTQRPRPERDARDSRPCPHTTQCSVTIRIHSDCSIKLTVVELYYVPRHVQSAAAEERRWWESASSNGMARETTLQGRGWESFCAEYS